MIKACDVGAGRDSHDTTDHLAHREHRHVTAIEVNRARTRSNRLEGRGGARSRRDDEVALELDVSDGSRRIKSDGRAAEEVRRAANTRAPDRVGERGEVDGELGDIGGKGRGTVRRPDPPLAGADAEGSIESTGALEASVIILEGKIRGRRQGEAVLGDERPAREARVTGIGVSLVTQDPPGAVTTTRDAQLADKVRTIGQQQVDAIITGTVAGQSEGTCAGETAAEVDRPRVREDDRGIVIIAALGVVAVPAVGFDAGVAKEREETVGAHAGGLGRLIDVDRTVVIGGRRGAGVKKTAAAQEHERSGVRAGVRRVARADTAGLTDIGEGGDRERAAVDDGSPGVGVESGERLDAATRLHHRQFAGTVGEDGRKDARSRASELDRLSPDREIGDGA